MDDRMDIGTHATHDDKVRDTTLVPRVILLGLHKHNNYMYT